MHFKCCFLYLFVFKYVQTCLNYTSNVFYKNSKKNLKNMFKKCGCGGPGAPAVERGRVAMGGASGGGCGCDRDGGGSRSRWRGNRDQVSS